MDWFDTNGNGAIEYGDNVDSYQIEELHAMCDFNGDGMVDICEYH
jgi:hypothetical protein